jgi:phosphopantetheinyl transferase (holo-ACP synthase)
MADERKQRIGTSIVDVERIVYLMENKEKLFSMLNQSEMKTLRGDNIAKIIAAKQAFFKAMSDRTPDWKAIEIIENIAGEKINIIDPELAAQIKKVQLSTSADGDYALAFIIVELN